MAFSWSFSSNLRFYIIGVSLVGLGALVCRCPRPFGLALFCWPFVATDNVQALVWPNASRSFHNIACGATPAWLPSREYGSCKIFWCLRIIWHQGARSKSPFQLLYIQLPYKSWKETLATPHTAQHVISCQLHALRFSGYIFTGGREESQRNGGVPRVMEWHGVLHNTGWGKPFWMASTCKQHILVFWVEGA